MSYSTLVYIGYVAYWIGVPYWSKGYCTEASRAILEFGFKELNLNRIYALAMDRNAGSYKVMEKNRNEV